MRFSPSGLIYSPSDLIRFMQSPFACWMDRFHLENPGILNPDQADVQQTLIAGEGDRHEQAYLVKIKAEGMVLTEIAKYRDFALSAAETRTALCARKPAVYQGALQYENFAGYTDFLLIGPGGIYEVWDTKLGRSPKPYYLVQLCCYAELLEAVTCQPCSTVGVILVSDQTRLRTTGEALDLRRFNTREYRYYYRELRQAFLKLMSDFVSDLSLRPVPRARANHGRWQSHADAWFQEIDHLSRVATITTGQIQKLEAAGIRTVAALANSEIQQVAQMSEDTRSRLVAQARLQVATRELRQKDPGAPPAFQVIADRAIERRGLRALPPVDHGDIYFDMEGFPLAVGGLEYLFGACYHEPDGLIFRDWWAHDRAEEKKAFEGFIDWAFARWRQNPRLHIYHYAAYEVSALRRLSTGHATREEEVDQMLRGEVFVDLYRIVRHAILLGEESYSLKRVEHVYRGTRQGEVETAGDSIVQYANWIASGETGDPAGSPILKSIRDYNEDDCRSTADLVFWLRQVQTTHGLSFHSGRMSSGEPEAESTEPVDPAGSTRSLLQREAYDETGRLIRPDLEALSHLLDFHRREDKPIWWRMFDRIAAPVEELADDISCLSSVEAVGLPVAHRKSWIQVYSFSPEEDTKLSVGTKVMFTHEKKAKLEVVSFDHSTGKISLKLGPKNLQECFGGQFPAVGSLIPDEFVPPHPIPAGIERAALAYLHGSHPLLAHLLERKPPLPDAGALVPPDETPGDAAIRIAGQMHHGVLCVQGPPGTGKTYTGGRILAALLQAGKRVGVMSNSHKAILNLLRSTGSALPDKRALIGIKIGSETEDPFFEEYPGLRPVKSGGDGLAAYQESGGVVGATAWPLSRPEWDGVLDYLIVDEAGQVSLANLVGVSLAARNLILLGDQMQLEQPIQGTHPGETGRSALQYYLQHHATIPPELGIFLDRSFRMHPEVCRFISETAYEGRLQSVSETGRQRIEIDSSSKLVTQEAGVLFSGVEHEGNVQASDEEIERVIAIFTELRGRLYRDINNNQRRLSLEDFVFISPYNLQANRLRAKLPDGARVGSVDKFQGQEAPVAILSMGSSCGEYGSRGLGFLLDRNRINVAISRAQCLAVVVGDPRIAHTEASSLQSMALINLYCRLIGYSAPQSLN